jgi:hypothetical protein
VLHKANQSLPLLNSTWYCVVIQCVTTLFIQGRRQEETMDVTCGQDLYAPLTSLAHLLSIPCSPFPAVNPATRIAKKKNHD